MKRAARLGATVVALCAIALTVPAWADTGPQPTPAPPAEGGTPLALRAGKAIELAQEPQHAGLGWKIAAVLAVLGGVALYARKRGLPKKLGESGELTIVRRAALGMRSELLVVNVEGQRLLIGVTPHSIQSLAILDADEDRPVRAPAAQSSSLGERFAAMLGSAEAHNVRDSERESPAPTAAAQLSPAARSVEAEDDVAGQARGLLSLRRGA